MSKKEELTEAKNKIRLFLRSNSQAIGADVVNGAIENLNSSFSATHKLAGGLEDDKKDALFANMTYVYNTALDEFKTALATKEKDKIASKIEGASNIITDATSGLLQKYEAEREKISNKVKFSDASTEVTTLLKAIGLTQEAEAVTAAVDGAIKASVALTPEKASYVFAEGAKTLIGSAANIDEAHDGRFDRKSRVSVIKEIVSTGVRDLNELPNFASRLNVGGDKGKPR